MSYLKFFSYIYLKDTLDSDYQVIKVLLSWICYKYKYNSLSYNDEKPMIGEQGK